MQSESSIKKRNACLTCTRAKARCSPSDQSSDGKCHRCLRLNKPCEYEIRYKKPGPQSRSRVKQLEQRVESLIELITANHSSNHTAGIDRGHAAQPPINSPSKQPTPPITDSSPSRLAESIASPPTPIAHVEHGTFQPWDPIEAGVISEQHADSLLQEFKISFVSTFPFIVLDAHANASTMHRQQPFLLHAILAVTSYQSPQVQYKLGEEFRRQLARIVEHSCKSLETLQGLMVYTAWYHTFYHPRTQQIALMVQMCVALVQDLGYDFDWKQKSGRSSRMKYQGSTFTKPEDVIASKRAFLGTYCLSISFAQAWRKRPSMVYTRYMAQCCESFKHSCALTDVLISPMVQLCELWSRVNDHFSYDNIEYTEVHGELMLSMLTTTFRQEVKRIRDSIVASELAEKSAMLRLWLYALEIQIDECCIHSSLWRTYADGSTSPPSPFRLTMFDRTMRAAMAYMQILLDLDKADLFHLPTHVWTAWFHILIVICKLVFVRDSERMEDVPIEDLPAELINILPCDPPEEQHDATPGHQQGLEASWSPLAVARQYGVQAKFEQLMQKFRFSLPEGTGPWSIPIHERDSLHSVACIQQLSLHGFAKRIKRSQALTQNSMSNHKPLSAVDAQNAERINKVTGESHSNAVLAAFMDGQMMHPTVQSTMPFASFMDFGTMNLDGIELPGQYGVQQEHVNDWMWNTMMEDFSMPTW